MNEFSVRLQRPNLPYGYYLLKYAPLGIGVELFNCSALPKNACRLNFVDELLVKSHQLDRGLPIVLRLTPYHSFGS